MGQSVPFIVMELLTGIPLLEIRAFTFARIIEIGKQVSDALDYIHQEGFLYRDLKPGNIILENQGFHYSVKLLDFGLACRRGETYFPAESTRAGTVFYLAPELISGGLADVATDLYALGATLYEMTTGRVPFSNIDEQNILSQHLVESVTPPSDSRSDMPAALESITMRLLEKNPSDRFASAADVCTALEYVFPAGEAVVTGNLPHGETSPPENGTVPVIQLLESSRVVSLLDDDGELAVAVGRELQREFAQGVWLVQFDSVSDPATVPQTVASVLGVPENIHRPQILSLVEHLREKNVLLILGRVSHLRPACAQLMETILRACPDVYILAASDQPFNVSGEKSYRR
jgi:serine/threonine protein kinase